MNCNHTTTCPLCRLENVATRLEAVLAALGTPHLPDGFTMPEGGKTPASQVRSALNELLGISQKDELDALAQYEDGIQQDYNKRAEAWNLREQAVQEHRSRTEAWNLHEQEGR